MGEIRYHADGAIATVTLHNPARLNALSLTMWTQLTETMNALAAADGLRCVVVRGEGERAFSAGADISGFEQERNNPEQARRYAEQTHTALLALRDCRHPTVAMIHGICVGGGLELATMCDIRVCGESSRFGIPANRLGLCVGYDEITTLIELVGTANAREILLEGRIFDAGEAQTKGLINRVVADDQVTAEAYASAERIAAGAPLVNRWHRKFINRLNDPTPLSAAELDEVFDCFATEDYQTGYRARLTKTTPVFNGK